MQTFCVENKVVSVLEKELLYWIPTDPEPANTSTTGDVIFTEGTYTSIFVEDHDLIWFLGVLTSGEEPIPPVIAFKNCIFIVALSKPVPFMVNTEFVPAAIVSGDILLMVGANDEVLLLFFLFWLFLHHV